MKNKLILTPLVMLLLLTSNAVLAQKNTLTVGDRAQEQCAMAADGESSDISTAEYPNANYCCSKSLNLCVQCIGGGCSVGPYTGIQRDNSFNAPVTSGILAPTITTSPKTPIKPSVIAPSNRSIKSMKKLRNPDTSAPILIKSTILAPATITSPKTPIKPSVIAPSNRVLPKASVIVPNNKTIKQ